MAPVATTYSIVVLDIENFSARTNPIQRSLRSAMYEVVDEAVARTLREHEGIKKEDRGDGILMLVPAAISPVLLAGDFVRALDDELKAKAPIFSEAHAMRFRVALHQGLAAPDPRGFSGDAINFAYRLVDAQPVRDVLKAASKARMAFIVSDEIYRGVVRHDYLAIDAATYQRMSFVIKNGRRATGWVTVPGYPSPPGLPEEPQSDDEQEVGALVATDTAAAPPAGTTVTVTGSVEGGVFGGNKNVTVHELRTEGETRF
ncbi:hypothetical protein [Streptomyces sp. UNOB3_S3]|uniref:hypothetical protein n=1 Tax=Streptomyces sp. UNOB3_S3 TaxID=2871682 RepID=UPI001E526C4F|nr:hypothetical protein [Streptomyces sp. UNOB3_S3]MCC3777027.1 hypothetical protein [Streptomyces sp. UNOB3_S3]